MTQYLRVTPYLRGMRYLHRLAGTAPVRTAPALTALAFAALTLASSAPPALALAAPPAYAAPAPAPAPAVRYVPPGYDAPSDDELAGSAAGAGREHPGRPASEPPNPETVLASRPLPMRPRTAEQVAPPRAEPSPPPAPRAHAMGTEPNERAADLAAHILPLGTGFALMGLGLGYMGVRLRRG
ncbi:hypothetical protein OHS33_17895 [Streptomyces sp. NBC_00536]|uniref:hypothetical protein n=1 Tax=Streptomyces sp. NBC_00536 TaxID=2975769 RepID=UPI002E7FFE8E|nr:hypothetical protein [Streptomyces sp. NBC_00536]WUC80054.1 hypothetical protein OHS33_17895 [Streptomyces sp. NBC_00536]